MQVSKWGNSLAVRLPKALVEQLGLKEGDELNVVAASKDTIAVETKEARRLRALAEHPRAKLDAYRRTTSSTATRPTSGECVFRHQHSRLRPADRPQGGDLAKTDRRRRHHQRPGPQRTGERVAQETGPKLSPKSLRFSMISNALDPARPLTAQNCRSALAVADEHGLSFYDALIVASAIEAGCDTLYSEDMQHGRTIGKPDDSEIRLWKAGGEGRGDECPEQKLRLSKHLLLQPPRHAIEG